MGEYTDLIAEFEKKRVFPQMVVISGSAVRIIEKNKVGFHYANTPCNKEMQIEKALESARVLDTQYPQSISFPGPQRYPYVHSICDPAIENAHIDDVVAYCTSVADDLQHYGISVRGTCSCRAFNFVLENSKCLEVEETNTHFMLDMDTRKGEHTFNVVRQSRLWNKETESLTNAIRERFDWYNLKKREFPTDNLALGTRALYAVLHPFVWQLSIDRAQRGLSRMKVSHCVAGKSFSLSDDGTYPDGPRTSVCDGEGIASKKYSIIEKGILQTFMYDHFHALLKKTESTGNAVRTSIMAPPLILPRNLVVEDGGFSLNEFTGIFIEEFVNDKGANIVSGEYVFNVKKAFCFKEGEILGTVKPFVLRGNIFDLLQNICDVGMVKENPFPQHRELIAPYVFIQVPSGSLLSGCS